MATEREKEPGEKREGARVRVREMILRLGFLLIWFV